MDIIKRLRFKDNLRKSFIHYIKIIMIIVFILYVVFFLFDFFGTVVIKNRNDNKAVMGSFQEQYRAYEDEMEECIMDSNIQDILHAYTNKKRTVVNRVLYEFINGQEIRSYFTLLDKSGAVICSNFTEDNRNQFAISMITSGIINKMKSSPNEVMGFSCNIASLKNQECCYTIGRAISDYNGEVCGYLLFNLRSEDVKKILSDMTSNTIITDVYNNIVFSTFDNPDDPNDKQIAGKFFLNMDGGKITKLNGKYYYINKCAMENRSLYFYTIISMEMQKYIIYYGIVFFMLLAIIMIVITILITRKFEKDNTREIEELLSAIDEIGKGNHYQVGKETSEEVYTLYLSFEKVTAQLKEVMQKNHELLERRKNMEIKQLEAQFKPHFVFNVMESVRYQIDENPKAASQMLLSFANLLRYSINSGDRMVSLETDIEYINDFLLIQKIRYNNCLEYVFDIPDELLDCKIPKLLIQSIVENSVKHAYIQGKVLNIIISAVSNGENLKISVKDDGKGMTEGRLNEVRSSFSIDSEDKAINNIGLYNVYKVLNLLYGEGYGVSIESSAGCGTEVVLSMPFMMEE